MTKTEVFRIFKKEFAPIIDNEILSKGMYGEMLYQEINMESIDKPYRTVANDIEKHEQEPGLAKVLCRSLHTPGSSIVAVLQ